MTTFTENEKLAVYTAFKQINAARGIVEGGGVLFLTQVSGMVGFDPFKSFNIIDSMSLENALSIIRGMEYDKKCIISDKLAGGLIIQDNRNVIKLKDALK